MNMKELCIKIISDLQQRGADKVAVTADVSQMEELQFEFNEIDLLRSFTETTLYIKVIKDNKKANISLNQLNEAAISKAMDSVMADAENSQPDPAYDIAPWQESGVFHLGPETADRDRMYFLIDTFKEECSKKYPGLRLEGNITHYYSTQYYYNSNGVDFQQTRGGYVYVAMFSAREGKKVSSFNYTYGNYVDLQKSYWDVSLLQELIEQSVGSLECKPVPATFTGDVILVPTMVDEFISSLVNTQLTDRMIITNNSILKGRIGEKVLSEAVNLSSYPTDPDLAGGYFVTGDGFRSEKVDIFSAGVLQNYLLSHFGSRKTGLPMSKAGGCFVLEPGTDKLADMIKGIDKGLLVVRFAGGNPSINGDFSGVAKNSFYIENGKISYPVNETMISGNLLEIFKDVKGVSSDVLNSGNFKMPWVRCGGVTISS
ncbi:MAG: TldD/PmbA family protein [Candidatus Cloacimonetes bacterium]|nr:TldD/PmbA family protein [Candidatus Cloacimonadota bacterium]